MEEPNDTQVPAEPTDTGDVIDVQVTPAPAAEPAEAPEEESTSFVPPVEADDSPAPDAPKAAPVAPADEPTPVEASETDQGKPADPAAPTNPAPHKAGGPVVAIIAAIFVALGLVGVTVYAYMKSQDKGTTKTQTSSEQNQTDVSGQDVDETVNEVDDALKSTEEADFPEAELTDQSLNL